MELPQRIPRSSPERAGLSAPADEVPPHTAAPAEPDKAVSRESLVIAKADVVSKVREEQLTVVGDASAAGFTGATQEEGALAIQSNGGVQEEVGVGEATAAEASATLADEPVIKRFVPVKDVKTMLQSGLFEGRRIVYRNKKDRIDLLQGVIKGTSYFCLCGNCDKTDKELSAKAFEQHAKADSHNANDHIYLQVSKLSLFEISKKLKEATDASMLEEVFKDLVKDDDSDGFHPNNTSVAANQKLNMIERLELLEKRMEVIEEIQSQVKTLEKNVEFLVNETVRSHALFKELSEVLKKFGDI